MMAAETPTLDWTSLVGDERVHEAVLAAARRVCSAREVLCVAGVLASQSTRQISRDTGIPQSAVVQLLKGRPDKIKGVGAMAKIRAELERDPSLLAETSAALLGLPTTEPGSLRDDILGWFAGLSLSREHLFGPLTVLLVAHAVAPKDRSMLVSDLSLYAPRRAVNAALSTLRAAGYIATDGVHLTIRRTPIDDLKEQ